MHKSINLTFDGSFSEKSSETQIPDNGGPLPVAEKGPTAAVDVSFPLSRCRMRATAGKNESFRQKESAIKDGAALKMAPDSKIFPVISIILPNTIHKYRKKNL